MSYDQEFAEAMRVKLQRNRQQRASQGSEEAPKSEGQPGSRGLNQLREQIISDTLRCHPGLSREEVLEGMEAMGF